MREQKTSKQPFFSIIIPIYNAMPFLEQCVDSLLNQTFSDIEIILVNDGSTDEGLFLCQDYERRDERITVWDQKNAGRVAARKAGVRLAKGQYISFVDADDWVEKDMYSQIYKQMEKNGKSADIVAFGLIEEYGDRQIARKETVKAGFYEKETLEQLKEHILYDGYFFGFGMLPHLCDKVFRREVLLSSGFMEIDGDISYGEDTAASFRACLNSRSLQVLEITPYHYRQGNYTNGLRTLQVGQENFRSLYREFQIGMKKYPYRDAYEWQVVFYFWFVLLLRQFESLQSGDYLFPYSQNVFGKKVVLYGAGGFGIEVYKYIQKTGCCEITGWIDREYASQDKEELPLESLGSIYKKPFDYILITILNERTAWAIKEELCKNGIPPEKIQYIEEKCLKGVRLPEWLTD